MSEEKKEEPKKICPFWGGHDCVKERCGLWSFKLDGEGGEYECAFVVMAEALGRIDAHGIDITNHF
jgi:hypothetical protein